MDSRKELVNRGVRRGRKDKGNSEKVY